MKASLLQQGHTVFYRTNLPVIGREGTSHEGCWSNKKCELTRYELAKVRFDHNGQLAKRPEINPTARYLGE